jgi:hypothetical protein
LAVVAAAAPMPAPTAVAASSGGAGPDDEPGVSGSGGISLVGRDEEGDIPIERAVRPAKTAVGAVGPGPGGMTLTLALICRAGAEPW